MSVLVENSRIREMYAGHEYGIQKRHISTMTHHVKNESFRNEKPATFDQIICKLGIGCYVLN